ncbi:hypothetical protein [Lysobacter gummosus]
MDDRQPSAHGAPASISDPGMSEERKGTIIGGCERSLTTHRC